MTKETRFRRRDFVKLLGLLGLAAAVPIVATNIRQQSFWTNPFQLGVASGSPSADGFVLWTRLVSEQLAGTGSVVVDWELFDEANPEQVIQQGQAVALAELAHSVHVEVTGLAPNHWYGYRFRVAGYQSQQGRVRTLPTAGASVAAMSFAFASCQRYEDGYYTAYRHMRQQQPDFVCFVGDYIYEYGSRSGAPRPHTLRRIRDLQGYRDRYALYKSDPDLQAMHAECPWLVTWDDHEVENNYFSGQSTEGRGDISALRAAAYQAFYEHMPLRASSLIEGIEGLIAHGRLQLYQRFDVANLARFYLVDNRQYRAEPLCGKSPSDGIAAVCNDDVQEYRTMLGSSQEHWLAQQFTAEGAAGQQWHFVIQQTRFTPANYHVGQGNSFNRDSWDGYPAARKQLLSLMNQSKHANMVVIGGDIHQNWVAKVHADPYDVESTVIATEFTGTSISSQSRATPAGMRRHLQRNPHLAYANAAYRGYGLVEVSAAKMQVTLFAVDAIDQPDSSVSVLAKFEVPSGKPAALQQLL